MQLAQGIQIKDFVPEAGKVLIFKGQEIGPLNTLMSLVENFVKHAFFR